MITISTKRPIFSAVRTSGGRITFQGDAGNEIPAADVPSDQRADLVRALITNAEWRTIVRALNSKLTSAAVMGSDATAREWRAHLRRIRALIIDHNYADLAPRDLREIYYAVDYVAPEMAAAKLRRMIEHLGDL